MSLATVTIESLTPAAAKTRFLGRYERLRKAER